MSWIQDELSERYGAPEGHTVVEWCTGWPAINPALTDHVIDTDLSTAIVDYRVTHGRQDVSSTAGAMVAVIRLSRKLAGRIPDIGEYVRLRLGDWAPNITSEAPVVDDHERVRFSGEVTDRELDPSGRILSVTAVGFRARLGNVDVTTDVSWFSEPDGPRAARALAAAESQLGDRITTFVNPGAVTVLPITEPATTTVLAMLDELTSDSGSQLVENRAGELWWTDIESRRNLSVLFTFAASEVLDGLTWKSSRSTMCNSCTVEYGADTGSGRPTVTVEAAGAIERNGRMSATLTTNIANIDDATSLAALTAYRRASSWWDVPALSVDVLRTVPAGHLQSLLFLEYGCLVLVEGLPSLHPMQTGHVIVEGYVETMTPRSWTLALAVSDAALAAPPARWEDILPSDTSWAGFLPADMTWEEASRWVKIESFAWWVALPADMSWADYETETWASFA